MKDGPAERDRSTTFLDKLEDENFTFMESCLDKLFDRGSILGFDNFKVEFVLDDFLLGGVGGITGTNDFTVFGNGPNISNGREILVIG